MGFAVKWLRSYLQKTPRLGSALSIDQTGGLVRSFLVRRAAT
jgi:hypothetical protein